MDGMLVPTACLVTFGRGGESASSTHRGKVRNHFDGFV